MAGRRAKHPQPAPAVSLAPSATADYIAQHGMVGLQAAVTRGQHQYPDGMFFGGSGPTWSNLTLRQVLQQRRREGVDQCCQPQQESNFQIVRHQAGCSISNTWRK